MLNLDEEALICDLAETYHVLDYRALPVKMVALFASGLRDNSRIKVKISGNKAPIETVLLAAAVDRLSYIVWSNSEDGYKNRNRPKLIASQLLRTESEYATFSSLEEFEERWQKILKKGEK